MKRIQKLSIIVAITLISFGSLFANNDKKDKATNTTTTSTTQLSALSGKIIDITTGEALVGVKVEIEGTNHSCYTDFDGNFSFNKIKAGYYNISTSYISYNSTLFKSINLEDSSANTVKFEMNPIRD